MKQVRIILKSGKEVQWETNSEPMTGIMHAEEPCSYLIVEDGRRIHIAEDEIAAIIITPMVKCPHCGRWTVPNIMAKMLYGDSKNPGIQTQEVHEIKACEYCGAPIGG